MFSPTSKVRVQRAAGHTVFGQPKPGKWITEGCNVIKLRDATQRTSVRADSSATRGNAEENQVDAQLMVGPTSAIKKNDLIELRGLRLRVIVREPKFDLFGRLDHHVLDATFWGNA